MSEDIINRRAIQWFPGHMAKTLRLMETEIRNVDCVLQILDARIPLSSLNPEIERITSGKPHLYIMNKADLADPDITAQWLAYFKSAGAGCLPMNSKQSGKAGAVKGPIEKELSALMERRRKKGMIGARIRVMVVGIPNVGKSTFINSFAGAARAKAANKPGVTRGKQWITVDDYDLMDMPGVLWKKFDSLHDLLLGHLKVLALAAIEALSQLQHLLTTFVSHGCALDTCHFLNSGEFLTQRFGAMRRSSGSSFGMSGEQSSSRTSLRPPALRRSCIRAVSNASVSTITR